MQVLFLVLASGSSLAAALLVVWWLEMRRQHIAQATAVQALQGEAHARQWALFELESRMTRALDAFERRDWLLCEHVALLNEGLRDLEGSWHGSGALEATSLPAFQAELASTEGDPAGLLSRLDYWEARIARHGDALSAELSRQARVTQSLNTVTAVALSAPRSEGSADPSAAGMMLAIDELRAMLVEQSLSGGRTAGPSAHGQAAGTAAPTEQPSDAVEVAEFRSALAVATERIEDLSQTLEAGDPPSGAPQTELEAARERVRVLEDELDMSRTHVTFLCESQEQGSGALEEVEAGLEEVLEEAGFEAPTWPEDDAARQSERMLAIDRIGDEWSVLRAKSIGLEEHALRVARALTGREREVKDVRAALDLEPALDGESEQSLAERAHTLRDRFANCGEELALLVEGLRTLAAVAAAPVEDDSNEALLVAVARALGAARSELGAVERSS